ncbi:hypothetical protein ACFYPN_02775 [Streptomyces sp. NPDC005576]|uniref:hypothetical protein n=1 Tax=Streptomyces sp. NPDC005576 TaxID=3364726 RepID=UPI0036B23587
MIFAVLSAKIIVGVKLVAPPRPAPPRSRSAANGRAAAHAEAMIEAAMTRLTARPPRAGAIEPYGPVEAGAARHHGELDHE